MATSVSFHLLLLSFRLRHKQVPFDGPPPFSASLQSSVLPAFLDLIQPRTVATGHAQGRSYFFFVVSKPFAASFELYGQASRFGSNRPRDKLPSPGKSSGEPISSKVGKVAKGIKGKVTRNLKLIVITFDPRQCLPGQDNAVGCVPYLRFPPWNRQVRFVKSRP
ncbi:uncharacterized protein BCR38DRAFT_430315, partial [Pseudomassariella vexata]